MLDKVIKEAKEAIVNASAAVLMGEMQDTEWLRALQESNTKLLTELNTFIERLESEELVEKVELAIFEIRRSGVVRSNQELAKAAIKSIKDMI